MGRVSMRDGFKGLQVRGRRKVRRVVLATYKDSSVFVCCFIHDNPLNDSLHYSYSLQVSQGVLRVNP